MSDARTTPTEHATTGGEAASAGTAGATTPPAGSAEAGLAVFPHPPQLPWLLDEYRSISAAAASPHLDYPARIQASHEADDIRQKILAHVTELVETTARHMMPAPPSTVGDMLRKIADGVDLGLFSHMSLSTVNAPGHYDMHLSRDVTDDQVRAWCGYMGLPLPGLTGPLLRGGGDSKWQSFGATAEVAPDITVEVWKAKDL
jgi:hypothetical protein